MLTNGVALEEPKVPQDRIRQGESGQAQLAEPRSTSPHLALNFFDANIPSHLMHNPHLATPPHALNDNHDKAPWSDMH